ncbi:CSD domain-containing protein (plasmid) [Cupriavidus necator H16]|uniref:DUF1294 domain-containing protein n=1 Tax=Cupriavidus necator (strain ATCC 17699 / DSM 428 / KCTC 22496 / NCIMB 10442 / H16 / Stanier 337) TaxID=381666 RepID=Q7WXG5_CUPNH|nr:cold shock and DUF1294 domain-containing protein [Cupriavidus necator]AAP85921.1 conserved hypothetical protein [Cupriavidus necator H16]QCC05418.1 DUF1294 domain-containing protein [Cupriavidus necator H16]QQB81589.1 cold shock and DUF1294 domain-containing protein [Cupriavidus necator]
MKKAGQVKTWHADKGFGFIDVYADMKDVFFHVTALQTRAVTPTPGDRVSFELGKGKDGRIQALNVAIVGAPKSRSDASPLPVLAGLAALGFIVGGALVGYFPRQAGIVSLLASIITFSAYADDKTRASRNTWRTPETTLHLLALCGGWPGALAAQHLLRHKNRKREFQVSFWGTVAVNVGAMALWQYVIAA